jgi:DNA repair protein RadA
MEQQQTSGSDSTISALHANRPITIQRISTGSKTLDNLLCGSIETKAMTEFYGPYATGKTQLCHTLCTMVSQDKSQGGLCGKSIYIDTECKFRPERIVSIAQARGFNAIYTLSCTLCVKATTSHHQELILEKIVSLLEKDKKIRLLVVDSIINNYRAEFSDARTLSERQQRLYRFTRMLSNIAQTYRIAVVVTNQVNYSSQQDTAKPTGENIMAHSSTYRISLRRLHLQHNNNDENDDDGEIVAKVVRSLYHPENQAHFMISKKGIEDIQKS